MIAYQSALAHPKAVAEYVLTLKERLMKNTLDSAKMSSLQVSVGMFPSKPQHKASFRFLFRWQHKGNLPHQREFLRIIFTSISVLNRIINLEMRKKG